VSTVISAKEAAKLISDGATVLVGGFVGCSIPEEVLGAIETRFITEGFPRELTLMHCAGLGDGISRGGNHFAHEGLLKRVVAGHYNMEPKLGKLIVNNKVEAYNFPQGILAQWFRSVAGRKPGIITKVGLNTFVDPRLEGGKLNSATTEDLVEIISLGGEEWLWYKPFPINVAIVRGTSADENGNISIEREAVALEILPMALSAKANGGIVIVQVERIVKNGDLRPKDVVIPGITVDYIVLAEDVANHMQSCAEQYNPAYSGEVRVPLSTILPMPLNERKVIARRAAMELIPNAKVNLGIGIPEGVAMVASEEGVGDTMTLTVEAGPVGGVPAGGLSFGASINAEAILDQPYQFDFYDGGGLDLTFLGLAETDKHGNVNVSKFKDRIAGCGGFVNITQNTKTVIFCGTFTAGGLKIQVDDGKLTIVQEGKVKKFLKDVGQITFSGRFAQEQQQTVKYITERAVFELTGQGLTLTEIAPGVDLEKDILANMDFKPTISSDLKEMDSRIFRAEIMNLSSNQLQIA
jgi:Acyl CoA:acetate/3-ketoacid CoA transferase